MSAAKEQTSSPSVPVENTENEDNSTKPEFIYGGPFIKCEQNSLLNIATPVNLPLQGAFTKSFAYYTLKERLPVILTKVIDYLSREGSKIKAKHNAPDSELVEYIQYITKLKNDLITNKKFDLLTVDTPEAKKWNEWISSAPNQYYFTHVWVFTECYVYRRLREGCELSKGLKNFDPFDYQKEQAFQDSLELMCVVAEKLLTMLPSGDKEKRKTDFMTLLKISLWANKCDLSLSLGEKVRLGASEAADEDSPVVDPFEMITQFKDMLLVDDTAKISDLVVSRAETLAKAIEGNTSLKAKCSCTRLATQAGLPTCKPPPSQPPPAEKTEGSEENQEEEQLPEIPCPAKMTVAQTLMFDIVCDNSGYELFTDLVLAHFLVAQEVVKKVRFHVKSFPWFVSDVTPADFKYVLSSCANASYRRVGPSEAKAEEGEGEEPPPPRVITSDALKQLGAIWSGYVEDETFVVMHDDFWTSPHVYRDMKKYDPALYRKLQFAVAVLFKGDLNYRKLLGEINWNPTTSFDAALQGFMPAPVIALRTIKADLVCGLPKGKADQISKVDEKWMLTGNYGVIQLCAKFEPLKVSEIPCPTYGDTCDGVTCPEES